MEPIRFDFNPLQPIAQTKIKYSWLLVAFGVGIFVAVIALSYYQNSEDIGTT